MTKGKWILILILVFGIQGCATVKKDWGISQNINTIQAYQDFVNKHPESEFTQEAKTVIEKLGWEMLKKSILFKHTRIS